MTLACAGSAQGDEPPDDKSGAAVELLHRKYIDATVAEDAQAAGRLLAEDYLYVGFGGGRNRLDKKALLRNVSGGVLDSVTFGPVRTRVYGDTGVPNPTEG